MLSVSNGNGFLNVKKYALQVLFCVFWCTFFLMKKPSAMVEWSEERN